MYIRRIDPSGSSDSMSLWCTDTVRPGYVGVVRMVGSPERRISVQHNHWELAVQIFSVVAKNIKAFFSALTLLKFIMVVE